MFDIGFWELMLIALVALVVVGPERLPKLIRVTGLWIGRANASVQSIRSEISRELRAEELKQALNKTVDVSDINKIMDVKPKPDPSAPVKNDVLDSNEIVDVKPKPDPSAPVKNDVSDSNEIMDVEPTSRPLAAVTKDENGNG